MRTLTVAIAFVGSACVVVPESSKGGADEGDNTKSDCSFLAARALLVQQTVTATGNALDVAIDGAGLFVLQDASSQSQYTRSGMFSIDVDGYLRHAPTGFRVVGYADGTNSAVAPIKLTSSALQPNRTSLVTIAANLDSTATTPAVAWDAQAPGNTSNFSTSVSVYDSLGMEHKLGLYFRKVATNAWDYHVLADGAETLPSVPGRNVEIGLGIMAFTTHGALNTLTVTAPVAANFGGAAAAQKIAINLGAPLTASGSGIDGVTQYATSSSVSKQQQDGYASTALLNVTIDQNGSVSGVYSNGQRSLLGQLVIAKFPAVDRLKWAGRALFLRTDASGAPGIGLPSEGGRGALRNGVLEDLGTGPVDCTH